MATAGPRNLITDVPGILVGQAEDHGAITGTTIVLAEAPAAAAVDVRGGAPGSRETELLGSATLVERVDAIVLSGGSAFGLDAAAGVMDFLAAQRRGFAVGDGCAGGGSRGARPGRGRPSPPSPPRGGGMGRGSRRTAGLAARRRCGQAWT